MGLSFSTFRTTPYVTDVPVQSLPAEVRGRHRKFWLHRSSDARHFYRAYKEENRSADIGLLTACDVDFLESRYTDAEHDFEDKWSTRMALSSTAAAIFGGLVGRSIERRWWGLNMFAARVWFMSAFACLFVDWTMRVMTTRFLYEAVNFDENSLITFRYRCFMRELEAFASIPMHVQTGDAAVFDDPGNKYKGLGRAPTTYEEYMRAYPLGSGYQQGYKDPQTGGAVGGSAGRDPRLSGGDDVPVGNVPSYERKD
eukprot:TRINITY_DN23246_c0_g1_i1.p1 TRINITY_DN23246_c0_g1~~TRINITY_DN23246_c0_g1_i1.p1  ORF type:complete len:255 (-),score=24.67 TRINITY_DN23246_c0_g1_i1:68-832(-)